jgi:hypothetical protein
VLRCPRNPDAHGVRGSDAALAVLPGRRPCTGGGLLAATGAHANSAPVNAIAPERRSASYALSDPCHSAPIVAAAAP